MKPKDKCVSRELAQELWDLGWRIDSERSWQNASNCEGLELPEHSIVAINASMRVLMENEGCTYISAPDASEIMELLPEKIEADFGSFRMFPYKINGQYGCAFECYLDSTCNCDKCDEKECRTNEFADTLANALAKMLVYLTKEKLVEANNEK